MKTLATALAVLFALPAMAMENCKTPAEMIKEYPPGEWVQVAQKKVFVDGGWIDTAGVRRLLLNVKTGKYMAVTQGPDGYCDIEDFIGDPRDTGAAL